MENIIRQTVEVKYKDELIALQETDKYEKPINWLLSPQAVRTFILGSDLPVGKNKVIIKKKYFGNDTLIERCIITLATSRGLMLVGEPGTAKTMLSELLSAAICGTSTNTIQGSAGISEDMVKYSFNYAMLLEKGPVLESLVPAPLYIGMKNGIITRFEEITRTPAEIQDALISVLSDKVLNIPELKDNNLLFAKQGFNVIATANTKDKGVNEMSSALKRRFNFETVMPIDDIRLEKQIIVEQVESLSKENNINFKINEDVALVVATIYNELRNGISSEGIKFNTPSNVMSTAEAVSVFYQTLISSYYYGDKEVSISNLVSNISSAVTKENNDDLVVLKNYFNTVVKEKASKFSLWEKLYQNKSLIK